MDKEIKLSDEARDIAKSFEEKVHKELFGYLVKSDQIDKHVPQCPDVEDLWPEIVREYLPDGAREFSQYPRVSLGWVMFIGMALAKFWDEDWVKYAAEGKFYSRLREPRGYDHLDDTVVYDILKYEGEAADMLSDVVADCASRVYSMISHEHVEPGTEAALGCYLGALHQLYLAGMAMELKTLGYKMTPLHEA